MTPQNHAGKRLEMGGMSRTARVHCARARAIGEHDKKHSAQERPSRNGAGAISLLGATKSNRVDGDFQHALE
jgi:hypothetical protein